MPQYHNAVNLESFQILNPFKFLLTNLAMNSAEMTTLKHHTMSHEWEINLFQLSSLLFIQLLRVPGVDFLPGDVFEQFAEISVPYGPFSWLSGGWRGWLNITGSKTLADYTEAESSCTPSDYYIMSQLTMLSRANLICVDWQTVGSSQYGRWL